MWLHVRIRTIPTGTPSEILGSFLLYEGGFYHGRKRCQHFGRLKKRLACTAIRGSPAYPFTHDIHLDIATSPLLILKPRRTFPMSLVPYPFYYYHIDESLNNEGAFTSVIESHGMARVTMNEAVELWMRKRLFASRTDRRDR